MKNLRLAVIETGTPAKNLRENFGGYYEMFTTVFASARPDIELVNFPVYLDLALPDMRGFDGALITGSPYGVYEEHDFIAPLKDFIHREMATNTPIVGICFGHQIMAEALGGQVEKSEKGWGVGIHTYEIDNNQELASSSLFDSVKTISCLLSHQDQVVSLSKFINRIGGSSFCPNGILDYMNGRGLSFQMHPEFTVDFASTLLNSRRERIDPATFDEAKVSFSLESNRAMMITIIIDFFEMNLR